MASATGATWNDNPTLCHRCRTLFDSIHQFHETEWQAESPNRWMWNPFDFTYRCFNATGSNPPTPCQFCVALDHLNRGPSFGKLALAEPVRRKYLTDHSEYHDKANTMPEEVLAAMYNDGEREGGVSYAVLTGNKLLIVEYRYCVWLICYELELAAMLEPRLVGAAMVAGRPVAPDPLSDTSIELVTRWLQTCSEAHRNCQARSPRPMLPGASESGPFSRFVPTRLVDVGAPFERDKPPRLVDASTFARTSGASGGWTTLSHRWGDGKCAGVTTTANVGFRMEGIDIATLPQTFQDAIRLVRALGQRFLWVDSLCIVQDQPDDWKREFPLMGEVYKHATLTIAVHNSGSSTEGFLRPRVSGPEQFLVTPGDSTAAKQKIYLRRPLLPWQRQVDGDASSLRDRGWVMQEAVLSPRILHVCHDSMFWQCSSVVLSEGFRRPLYDPSFRSPRPRNLVLDLTGTLLASRALFPGAAEPRPSEYSLCLCWRELMKHYSTRNLSVAEDKLPAVAGLASHFKAALPLGYAAGIFEYDVHASLLWKTLPPGARLGDAKHLRHARAPSWSWASLDASVVFTPLPPIPPEERPEWDAAIRFPASDSAGNQSNLAQMEPLEITSYWLDSNVLGPEQRRLFTLALMIGTDRFATCNFDAKDFNEIESRNKRRDFGFLVICDAGRDSADKHAYCLLLEPTEEGTQEVYSRVGVATIDTEPVRQGDLIPPVEKWGRRTVKIV